MPAIVYKVVMLEAVVGNPETDVFCTNKYYQLEKFLAVPVCQRIAKGFPKCQDEKQLFRQNGFVYYCRFQQ